MKTHGEVEASNLENFLHCQYTLSTMHCGIIRQLSALIKLRVIHDLKGQYKNWNNLPFKLRY